MSLRGAFNLNLIPYLSQVFLRRRRRLLLCVQWWDVTRVAIDLGLPLEAEVESLGLGSDVVLWKHRRLSVPSAMMPLNSDL
jgi:hypothetical protein